jgi:hypothetical protein
LKVEHDKLLSNSAFNLYMRRYAKAATSLVSAASRAAQLAALKRAKLSAQHSAAIALAEADAAPAAGAHICPLFGST